MTDINVPKVHTLCAKVLRPADRTRRRAVGSDETLERLGAAYVKKRAS